MASSTSSKIDRPLSDLIKEDKAKQPKRINPTLGGIPPARFPLNNKPVLPPPLRLPNLPRGPLNVVRPIPLPPQRNPNPLRGPSPMLRNNRTPYNRTPYNRTPYNRDPYNRDPYIRAPQQINNRPKPGQGIKKITFNNTRSPRTEYRPVRHNPIDDNLTIVISNTTNPKQHKKKKHNASDSDEETNNKYDTNKNEIVQDIVKSIKEQLLTVLPIHPTVPLSTSLPSIPTSIPSSHSLSPLPTSSSTPSIPVAGGSLHNGGSTQIDSSRKFTTQRAFLEIDENSPRPIRSIEESNTSTNTLNSIFAAVSQGRRL